MKDFKPIKEHLIEPVTKEFLGLIDIRGPEDCWKWKGKFYGRNEYGVFLIGENRFIASRVALVLSTGEDRVDMLSLHSCDNPPCCNPKHLRWGTIQDNTRDKMVRGRFRSGVSLGLQNGRAKLNRKTIIKMVKAFREGKGDTQVKRELNLPISQSNVRNIRIGKAWLSETSKLGWPDSTTPTGQ